jgi:hypothetical protein
VSGAAVPARQRLPFLIRFRAEWRKRAMMRACQNFSVARELGSNSLARFLGGRDRRRDVVWQSKDSSSLLQLVE